MGKEKKEKIIREFSSGGAVFKKEKGETLWIVRATVPSELFPKVYWTLPKGWIDGDETLEETAVREVKEEGGIEAKIVEKIGTIKYFYLHPERGNILKFVTFFLMEWKSDLPEGFDGETSEVVWLPFKEAYKKLSHSGEKQILKKANSLL